MGFTFVDDVTRALIGSAPAGANLAGYTTGSSGINWFSADWAAHPTAIRIDQDFAASDATADVLDVEGGAATPGECARWVKQAIANIAAGKRPGQRMPLIYASLSQISTITAAMKAGGVTGGVGLWIADWMNNQAAAEAMIGQTFGGFVCLGVQYRNAGAYDMDVFDSNWWSNRVVSQQPTFPLKQGMDDGPGATSGLIHDLQRNINRWASKLGAQVSLQVDGIFGPVTALAVTAAETLFGERGVLGGICDQALFTALAGAVPPVVPPTPIPLPAPLGVKAATTSTGAHANLSWKAVGGATSYEYQLERYQPKFGWVLMITKTVSTVSDTQPVPAATKFRYRVSSGTWSNWVEFTSS